ncbi:FUSC family protein [Mycolicibacterium palauense]|uniref:FUSC family protein n=1 Tax=Mycolicibacterium palauense TaxID=2034511 RepID=UPI000BFEDB2A|nr:FUSC family protein [Mycolicibacterium palauense]
MTGPDESQTSTRPISVAELLAKNGTIGAPPVGGRRRRRRGNSDAVTVAELTGEIPVVRPDDEPPESAAQATPESAPEAPAAEEVAPEAAQAAEETAEAAREETGESAPETAGEETGEATLEAPESAETPSEEQAPERADREPERHVPPELSEQPMPRRGRDVSPLRSSYPRPRAAERTAPHRGRLRFGRSDTRTEPDPVEGAELMSPDPLVDLEGAGETGLDDELSGLVEEADTTDTAGGLDTDMAGEVSYLRAYLDTTSGPLFGGEAADDDLARGQKAPDDVFGGAGADEERTVAIAVQDRETAEAEETAPGRGRAVLRGGAVVLQSIVAVVFGAGLFVAFDQLWKWNSIVAMVLAILVTLGLVAGVWVVRKTEDITSTLIAVGVGLLVTFGPLALMQAS